MPTSDRFGEPAPAGGPLAPFVAPTTPAPRYHAPGRPPGAALEDYAALREMGVCNPVLDALGGPAEAGRLGVVVDPLAFDPVVYVAIPSRTGEPLYVGRTYDLPARIARHRRAFGELNTWWPDVWASVRVPAEDAAHVEEGLIRALQAAGHPAQLLTTRRPYAGGRLVSPRQREAMRAVGMRA